MDRIHAGRGNYSTDDRWKEASSTDDFWEDVFGLMQPDILDVDSVNYVLDTLSEADMYAQLAEEASELAQAALKMQRYLEGRNLPRMSCAQLGENLFEEVSDIQLVLDMLGIEPLETLMQKKLDRWVKSLKNQDEEESESDEQVEILLSYDAYMYLDKIHRALKEVDGSVLYYTDNEYPFARWMAMQVPKANLFKFMALMNSYKDED